MRPGFDPWVGKIPWRRAWQPTPYSCLENPRGQRTLVSCSPRGRRESDMTEQLSTQQMLFYRYEGLSIHTFWYWQEVLEPIPQGHRRRTSPTSSGSYENSVLEFVNFHTSIMPVFSSCIFNPVSFPSVEENTKL